MSFGVSRLQLDRLGCPGADCPEGSVLAEQARHVALAFADPLDFDGDRVHTLLEPRQALRKLSRQARDRGYAPTPDPTCHGDAQGQKHHEDEHVTDTGPGIDQEQLPVIFEPFVQGDRALNRPNEGVGLGLAISRDLARGMAGDVTVTTELGVGSTFTLVLPRAALSGHPDASDVRSGTRAGDQGRVGGRDSVGFAPQVV